MIFRIGAAGALALGLFAAMPAQAHDFQVGAIRIDHPWARATPPAAPVAGGYVKLENTGTEPDRLVSVTTDLAASAELHQSTVTDGVARMRPLGGPLELPPGETVELKSGGTHIMFMKPARQLKKGEKFSATLTFEKAGPVAVEFAVQGMGESAPAPMDGMDHGASQGQ